MLRVAAFLLLVLLVPAASAVPFQATLHEAREPRMAGEMLLWSDKGTLNLTDAVEAGGLSFSMERGEGVRVRVETHRLESRSQLQTNRSIEDVEWGAGELRVLRCGAMCAVFVTSEELGRVGLEGEWSGAPGWLRFPAQLCADIACSHSATSRTQSYEPGSWRVHGDGGALRPLAEGDLVLVARDAVLEWRSRDGDRQLVDVLTRREDVAPMLVREEQRYFIATVRGSALRTESPAPAVLHADTLHAVFDGVFSTPEATGTTMFNGEETRLDGDPLDVRGKLAVTLHGGPGVILPDAPVRASGTLDGDASSLRAGARAAIAPREAQADAALLVGLAALLALLALLVPAYSRISRSRVMTNANRALVHDVLTSAPGRTVPEVARATGLATVVVRHHLAILLAHGVVVRRADGRLRRYYPAGQVPSAHAIAREGALADATRRAVAEALAAFPDGATQRQLMERTGLSQRLVSYHLGRLRDAGLVREEAGLPKRYRSAGAPGP